MTIYLLLVFAILLMIIATVLYRRSRPLTPWEIQMEKNRKEIELERLMDAAEDAVFEEDARRFRKILEDMKDYGKR